MTLVIMIIYSMNFIHKKRNERNYVAVKQKYNILKDWHPCMAWLSPFHIEMRIFFVIFACLFV